nr:hypothetical protein [Micromonospora sp. DSM 115978]
VILVGERLASSPGGFSAALRLAEATGARLGWVPRRAGERGALVAGAFPSLLPGGRPVADAAARAEVEAVWGGPVPSKPGRDTAAILAAVESGALDGLVVGGVDLDDLPDDLDVTKLSGGVETAVADTPLTIRVGDEREGVRRRWWVAGLSDVVRRLRRTRCVLVVDDAEWLGEFDP